MPDVIESLTRDIVAFRDARDWRQFHNPKDLALALSIEAAELNERFLWKRPEDADTRGVREELADVMIYALLLAHACDLSMEEIVREKLRINEVRYPVERARGNARKHGDP